MKTHFEVVVIGGGPAGSTLGYELALKGLDVLIIDKERFPRPKCCGGGVTVRANRLLGELLPGIYEDSISGADFAVCGSTIFRGRHEGSVMHTVTREKFDHLLLQRAERAGAKVAQGVSAEAFAMTSEYIGITTSSGSLEARFVVGADGNRSVVAPLLGDQRRDSFVGIETELVVSDNDLARWKSLVLVDIGWTPKGYAWVFPKKVGLSVGIGCQASQARSLRTAYRRFLDSLDLSDCKTARSWGGVIPTYVGRPHVVQGRVALLGDAAGLADPLTGEGIGNAIFSAQLAAPAIQDALAHGVDRLLEYQRAVEEKMVPDIEAARFFARIIYTMPKKLLEVARVDGRIWNAACALVRGETGYSSIKGRVGTVGGLYSILRGKTAR